MCVGVVDDVCMCVGGEKLRQSKVDEWPDDDDDGCVAWANRVRWVMMGEVESVGPAWARGWVEKGVCVV